MSNERRNVSEALPLIGEGLSLIGEELDAIREEVRSDARTAPILVAIGELKKLVVDFQTDLVLLDEKIENHRVNVNGQIRDLKKAASNGASGT